MIQLLLGMCRPFIQAFKHSRDSARRKLVFLTFTTVAFIVLLFGVLTAPPPTEREIFYLLINFVGVSVYLLDVAMTKLWRLVVEINNAFSITRRPVSEVYEA